MNRYEFELLLSKLTTRDLDSMHTELYREFGSYPVWDTGGTKAQNIAHFTYWVKGHPDRVAAVVNLADKKLGERYMAPTSGPVPNTRYITWKDFTSLPSYKEIAEAVEYRYDPNAGNRYNPVSKDGYVSVYAIYNMSAWSSWKSSSLSEYERVKANAIGKLHLSDLMALNAGRRMDQPALFPMGMLA